MKRFGISCKQDLEELQQILADAKADAEARVKLLEMHLKKTVPFEMQFLEECKLRIKRIDKLVEIFKCSENETVEKDKQTKYNRCADCKHFSMDDMKSGVFQYKCNKGIFVNHPDVPCCEEFEEP